MTNTTDMTISTAGIPHTPWCRRHYDYPTPESGWCKGDPADIAGFNTRLTMALNGRPAIYMQQLDGGADVPLAEAEELIARLTYLVRVARAPEPAEEAVVKTIRTVAEACGTTLEEVAAEIGADAAALTRGDVDALKFVFGARLAAPYGKSGWSVEVVQGPRSAAQ